VESGQGFYWDLQSGQMNHDAAQYSISTMTRNVNMGDAVLSFLKITLPWQLLETLEGTQQFMDWVVTLCEALEIEHGYAGLACNLPYGDRLYQPHGFRIAQQYSGLIEDSVPSFHLLQLVSGIKAVNWLTLLGPGYIDKLGGRAPLMQSLRLPDVEVKETANGCFIIRAGLVPALGVPTQDGHPNPPPAYVAVKRVLKPVCITRFTPLQVDMAETSNRRIRPHGAVQSGAAKSSKCPNKTVT
jgi:hypothetical protein